MVLRSPKEWKIAIIKPSILVRKPTRLSSLFLFAHCTLPMSGDTIQHSMTAAITTLTWLVAIMMQGKVYLCLCQAIGWFCITATRDYLKFTLPLAHSIAFLSWGAIEWYDGYTKANQTEYLRDTIRWGTDWLIKAHPKDDVLYVQVSTPFWVMMMMNQLNPTHDLF